MPPTWMVAIVARAGASPESWPGLPSDEAAYICVLLSGPHSPSYNLSLPWPTCLHHPCCDAMWCAMCYVLYIRCPGPQVHAPARLPPDLLSHPLPWLAQDPRVRLATSQWPGWRWGNRAHHQPSALAGPCARPRPTTLSPHSHCPQPDLIHKTCLTYRRAALCHVVCLYIMLLQLFVVFPLHHAAAVHRRAGLLLNLWRQPLLCHRMGRDLVDGAPHFWLPGLHDISELWYGAPWW